MKIGVSGGPPPKQKPSQKSGDVNSKSNDPLENGKKKPFSNEMDQTTAKGKVAEDPLKAKAVVDPLEQKRQILGQEEVLLQPPQLPQLSEPVGITDYLNQTKAEKALEEETEETLAGAGIVLAGAQQLSMPSDGFMQESLDQGANRFRAENYVMQPAIPEEPLDLESGEFKSITDLRDKVDFRPKVSVEEQLSLAGDRQFRDEFLTTEPPPEKLKLTGEMIRKHATDVDVEVPVLGKKHNMQMVEGDIDAAQLLAGNKTEGKDPYAFKGNQYWSIPDSNMQGRVVKPQTEPIIPRQVFGLSGLFVPLHERQENPENSLKSELNLDDSTLGIMARSEHSSQTAKLEAARTQAQAQAYLKFDGAMDFDSIVHHVRRLGTDGSNELTMELNPEHLGKLTLRIREEGNSMKLDMLTDNPVTRQLLEANMNELKQRLYSNDIKYDNLSFAVDVEQNPYNRDGDQNYRGGSGLDDVEMNQRDRLEKEVAATQQYRRAQQGSGLSLYA